MPFTTPPPFMTPQEVAPILGGKTTAHTVCRMCREGVIKAKKVGGEWRIMPAWLTEYMSEPSNQPPERKRE